MDLKATMIPVQELVTGRARLGLWMLAGSVGAVLLIVIFLMLRITKVL
jgi:hypothetical protein